MEKKQDKQTDDLENINVALKTATLKTRPVTSPFSLLFLNARLLEEQYKDKEDEVLSGIMKQLKSRIVFVKWTQPYFENQSKIPPNIFDLSTAPSDVRNFPSSNSEKLQNTLASCTKEENVSNVDTAKRVFEELVSSNQDPRVNLIILAADDSGLKIAQELFAIMNKSENQKMYCVWGGETHGLIEAQYKEDEENYYRNHIFVGIRMFQSNMKSWSLIVDFREFEEKLVEFKENVELKRYSLGFVSGREAIIRQELICGNSMEVGQSRVVESPEIIAAVKASFPDLPLLGGFNLGLSIIYGYNSTGAKAGVISNKLAVSLMIITYD